MILHLNAETYDDDGIWLYYILFYLEFNGFIFCADPPPPAYRNIYDVNIDKLEEKPWRIPGVDITDYFNFGFNENTWKEYCMSLVSSLLCPNYFNL